MSTQLRDMMDRAVTEYLGREPISKAEGVRVRQQIYKANDGLLAAVLAEEKADPAGAEERLERDADDIDPDVKASVGRRALLEARVGEAVTVFGKKLGLKKKLRAELRSWVTKRLRKGRPVSAKRIAKRIQKLTNTGPGYKGPTLCPGCGTTLPGTGAARCPNCGKSLPGPQTTN